MNKKIFLLFLVLSLLLIGCKDTKQETKSSDNIFTEEEVGKKVDNAMKCAHAVCDCEDDKECDCVYANYKGEKENLKCTFTQEQKYNLQLQYQCSQAICKCPMDGEELCACLRVDADGIEHGIMCPRNSVQMADKQKEQLCAAAKCDCPSSGSITVCQCKYETTDGDVYPIRCVNNPYLEDPDAIKWK